MAKNQPKLTDMTEILLQQVIQLEQTIKRSEKAHLDTVEELSNIKVTVNVAELRQIEKEQQQRLRNDFEEFHREITKNNEKLLKLHKAVSSKRLLYLIVLNILLVLITGFSIYVAVKNTIDKSQYQILVYEKDELRNQLENVNQFFVKNPKTAKFWINVKSWGGNSKIISLSYDG